MLVMYPKSFGVGLLVEFIRLLETVALSFISSLVVSLIPFFFSQLSPFSLKFL
jgi:hypothetical protein